MSWEPMSLATAASDELGADVAAVRVAGLLDDDDYHLTGVDLLVAAGMAIAAAFCAGVVQGIIDEARGRGSRSSESGGLTDWGQRTGAALVRRLRRLARRITKGSESAPSEAETHDEADVTAEFTVLVATVRDNLVQAKVEVRQIKLAAENSKSEVIEILTELGLRADRAGTLAPRMTEALLSELAEALT